jgi:hypothetical protein
MALCSLQCIHNINIHWQLCSTSYIRNLNSTEEIYPKVYRKGAEAIVRVGMSAVEKT